MLRIIHSVFSRYVFFILPLIAGTSEAADNIKGGELYTTHCVECHGLTGISDMPSTPNFAQSENLMKPDIQLLIAIKNGKDVMPAYQGILKDSDILDIIAYLRTLN